MGKYLKLLPLMLYPYAYLIFFGVALAVVPHLEGRQAELFMEGFMLAGIVYFVGTIVIAIVNSVLTGKGHHSAAVSAKMNLLVKGVQIPAYIFHFIMGLMGTVMSVWGIGFIMLALVVDITAIFLTGINAIGCSVRMYKEEVIPKWGAILVRIGSFIFCIDVVIAVVCVILVSAKKQKDERLKRQAEILEEERRRMEKKEELLEQEPPETENQPETLDK